MGPKPVYSSYQSRFTGPSSAGNPNPEDSLSSGCQVTAHRFVCCSGFLRDRLPSEPDKEVLDLAVSLAFSEKLALDARHILRAVGGDAVRRISREEGIEVSEHMLTMIANCERPVLILIDWCHPVQESLTELVEEISANSILTLDALLRVMLRRLNVNTGSEALSE